MQNVHYKNRDITIAANLYIPESIEMSKKYPAIVVVHPGGGVKEQTAGVYAKALAEHGFITLAFDATYQGESGGVPHNLEDPATRVEDISAAVDYLQQLPDVDSQRIGVLGICAGGGYSVNAALFDKRIKAVATVSGIDISWLTRETFGENQDQVIAQILQQAAEQRATEAEGAELMIAPYVPNSPEEFTEATPKYAKEAYEYYRTPRAQHPNADNKMLFRSMPKVLGFDAFGQVSDLLTQPVLLVVGGNADTAYQAEEVYKRVPHDDKELFVVPGATHVSLYDQDVERAVPKLVDFFTDKL